MKTFKPAILAAAIGQLLPSAFAVADEPNSKADSAKPKNDEVVVSAQRIENIKLTDQNVTGSRLNITALETPATIQSLSGDMLRARGDTDIVRAVSRAVGITSLPTTGSGGYGFSARGFSSNSVTLLYDGMKSLINTGSTSYPYDTWNVERIDVLNGPASVLYGGGAIGAAMNIIPRKPSANAEHTLYVSAGSNSTYQTALDSTGPLTDDLLYRFDISRTSSDGYVQRGETDSTSITGSLKYLVNKDLSITLSADYGDRTGLEYLGSPLINGKQVKSLRHINYSSHDGAVEFTDYRGQVLIDWQPDEAVSVRNITTYLRGERLWKYAGRFAYQPLTNNIRRDQFGSYLQHQDQLDNHSEVAWQHTLFGFDNQLSFGLDLVHLSNDRYVDNYAAPSGFIDLRNSTPGDFPTAITSRNYQDTLVNQHSLFAEDRLQLTDALSLVAGIRFDHSDVERVDLVNDSSVDKLYTPESWRAGLVYALAPDFNVYAQYATAVDPVSNLCCIAANQLDYAMSEGKQWEVGLKQSALGGRLEWSLAAYDIVKNKLLMTNPQAPTGPQLQVGEQSARGVEASLAWVIDEAWRVEFNGTVLRARYEDFSQTVSTTVNNVTTTTVFDRKGNRPTNTPERSANLWVTWAFAPRWNAQTGVRYVGPIYGDIANSIRVDGYTVVDASLHWDAAENIGIDVRAKNLFDKFYAYQAGETQVLQGAPRTTEAALTLRF